MHESATNLYINIQKELRIFKIYGELISKAHGSTKMAP